MRQEVTVDELKRIFNEAFRARGLDCKVGGPVYRLKTPNPDGCNWSDPTIIRGPEVDFDAMAKVIADIRRMYNLGAARD